MNKEDYISLVIKGFGLYFLIQALLVVPDLLAGAYAYSQVNSTMSTLAEDTTKDFSQQSSNLYRALLLAPVVKIVLFSAAGMYLIKGGGFVFRLMGGDVRPED
jgi:hypothetical protein